MEFSEHSTPVVGFDSTWKNDKEVLVRDTSTDVMDNSVKKTETGTATADFKEIAVQATPEVFSNSNEETDKKLAAWLKKILPAVEKELIEGLTPVHSSNSQPLERALKVEEYQNIELKVHFEQLKNFHESELTKGSATWLSVSVQDSPVLALSCSVNNDEKISSFVFVYEPRRSKTDAQIRWQELAAIPVNGSIEHLITNLQNRDMFAGASTSGDLYIWQYHNMSNADNEMRVTEVFSASSESSVAAIAFLSENRLLCCQSDGKLVVYKSLNKKTTVAEKIMQIEPRNMKDPLITSVITIPDSPDDFVLGLLNGSLLYCSTNQLLPQEGTFNPIIRELHPHRFAISSLTLSHQNSKSYIVSCDLSGEIFFHETEDHSEKQPKLVIKLPMPLKNKIVLGNNMEHIFCPLQHGSLEIFKTSNKARESKIDGQLSGNGSVIEISRNESWLVTGIYNGTFRIFHVLNED